LNASHGLRRTICRCTRKVVETFRDSSWKRNRLRDKGAVAV
jgi:hypothetical protein